MLITDPCKLVVGARSDIGPRRRVNEDSGFASERLIVVADGVGGAVAGELASRLIVQQLAAGFAVSDNPSGTQVLAQVAAANAALATRIVADRELRGMATTMTSLIVSGQRAYLMHVGDSRAYRWRDGELMQLSVDQSWVQMLIDEQLLEPAEARRHPMRNLLLHSLSGAASDIDAVRITELELRPGDRFLLATDGLTSYLPGTVLIDILADSADVQEAADLLVEHAWPRSRDNITAIVADVVPGAAGAAGRFIGAADAAGPTARHVV